MVSPPGVPRWQEWQRLVCVLSQELPLGDEIPVSPFPSRRGSARPNPAALETSPKLVHRMGFTLSREEVRKLLDGEGTPKDRLLAHWTFYAPSRRKTFTDARWPDIDLDAGTWEVVGKGGKVDVFVLAAPLVRELRAYRRWQLSEAQRNLAVRDAQADPATAYVLLTKNGNRTHDEHIAKRSRSGCCQGIRTLQMKHLF